MPNKYEEMSFWLFVARSQEAFLPQHIWRDSEWI